MEQLYSIMRDFLELEHNQEALLCLLKAAEAAYSKDMHEESELVANSAKYYLKALQGGIEICH